MSAPVSVRDAVMSRPKTFKEFEDQVHHRVCVTVSLGVTLWNPIWELIRNHAWEQVRAVTGSR